MDDSGRGRGGGMADGPHGRTASRDSMFLQAHIARTGRSDILIRVRNLSAGGMMGETTEPFAVGEAVDVALRGIGSVAGHIAWVANGRVGVAFAASIDPKLTRKAPPQSPGSGMVLVQAATNARRPAIKAG